jgi:hypothetical protein
LTALRKILFTEGNSFPKRRCETPLLSLALASTSGVFEEDFLPRPAY